MGENRIEESHPQVRQGDQPTSGFEFPEVGPSYRPTGKVSGKAYQAMLLAGLSTATIGGLISYLLQYVLVLIASWAAGITVTAVVLYLIGPGIGILLGYLIGLAVDVQALKNDCRNHQRIRIVMYVSGVASAVAYLLVWWVALKTAFSSSIDYYLVVSTILGTLFGVFLYTQANLKVRPFCERCGEDMKKRFIGTYPVRLEARLMQILASGDSHGFRSLVEDSDSKEKNVTTVVGWYCDSCKETGYIDAFSKRVQVIPQKDGSKKEIARFRRIFSSPATESQIEVVLDLGKTREPVKSNLVQMIELGMQENERKKHTNLA